MKNDFLEELFFSAAFPLPFRVLCLLALGILGWATNLHGLHLWGIDAAGVLDLNNYDGYRLTSPLPTVTGNGSGGGGWKRAQPSAQTYRPVYKAFAAFAGWVLVCWVAYRGATGGDVEGVDGFKFVPAVAALGALMDSPHESCATLYDCSCPEVDTLVRIAKRAGAYGSRVTGAGWGGCTVSLVAEDKVEEFIEAVKAKYAPYKGLSEVQLREAIFATKPSTGAFGESGYCEDEYIIDALSFCSPQAG